MGNTEKFDLIAKNYDSNERIDIAKICSDMISKHLKESDKKTAIDFGCGTGLVGINLVDQFASVIFMDSSANMIEIVNQKIQNLQIDNATALCHDMEINSIPNIQSDYIIMVQVLLHIKDTQKILNSLYKLLNKNGHLIIIDFDKNEDIVSEYVHNGFEQRELTDVLQRAGFSNVKSETFFTGENIFMGKSASLFIMNAEKL